MMTSQSKQNISANKIRYFLCLFASILSAMNQAFFFSTVAPALGVVVTNVRIISPYKAVMDCRKRGHLGPLNPIPLAVSFLNLFGWTIYAMVLNDLFLLLSVFLGVLLNFLGVSTAISMLGMQKRLSEARRMERIITFGLSWWIFIGISALSYIPDRETLLTVLGMTTFATTVLYYFSPLTALRIIIKHKDASSLYLPMILGNLLATSLWFVYGLFATNNMWLYLPQGMGMGLSLSHLAIKLYYTPSSEEVQSNIRKMSNASAYELANTVSTAALDSTLGNMTERWEPPLQYTQADVNIVMGMNAGSLGLGGIGLPGLVDLDYTTDGMVPASVLVNGMDLQHAMEDLLPTAAAGVMAVFNDVKDIISNAFVSTSQEGDFLPPMVTSTPTTPAHCCGTEDFSELRNRALSIDSITGEEVEGDFAFHGS